MSVGSAQGAQTPFNVGILAQWMHKQGLLDRAELSVRALTGGQSNPTFRLSSGAQQFVLRKKPPGPLLPSAHAVEREYKVMKALEGTEVPVPKMFAYCEDESVVGTPFFVMEFLDGRVMVDQSLPGMSPPERRAMNPADPANVAVQAKINADWYIANHSKTFQSYLDFISS